MHARSIGFYGFDDIARGFIVVYWIIVLNESPENTARSIAVEHILQHS